MNPERTLPEMLIGSFPPLSGAFMGTGQSNTLDCFGSEPINSHMAQHLRIWSTCRFHNIPLTLTWYVTGRGLLDMVHFIQETLFP